MALVNLPVELLLQVTKDLGFQATYSLARTSRHFASQLRYELRRFVPSTNRRCVTALYFAAANGDEDMVRLLLNGGADIVVSDSSGNVLFHREPREFNFDDAVKLILDEGAEVVVVDDRGRTAVHQAVLSGHIGVLRRLIDKGARIDDRDIDGWAPLHLATRLAMGELGLEMMKILLDRGANIDVQGKFGWTALHRLSLRNLGTSQAALELLLQRGANTSIRDVCSRTAVAFAAYLGNTHAVEKLLEYGADIMTRDDQGHIPAQIALNEGFLRLSSLLLRAHRNLEYYT